ncbi:hypothetical protein N9P82_01210 [bacterium]|nr:hypothetical protein [bacterium]
MSLTRRRTVEPMIMIAFIAELFHLRNSLPDDLIIQRIDERLSGWSPYSFIV